MRCSCGCGELVTSTDPRARYAAPAHRVRAWKARASRRAEAAAGVVADRARDRDLVALLQGAGPAPWLIVGGHAVPLRQDDVVLLVAAATARPAPPQASAPAPWPGRSSSCACGCGARVAGRTRYANGACRARALRERRRRRRAELVELARATRRGETTAVEVLVAAAALGLTARLRGRRGLVTLSALEVEQLVGGLRPALGVEQLVVESPSG